MSDLAYADDIVILSSRYIEMQGLLRAVNRHAEAVGIRINASKAKVMPALIPDEQRQAVLLDGEPFEDVGKFKYLGSMFVANGQDTEEIKSRINLDRSAFSRLQSCLWSRREMSLRTKGRVYQAEVRSILLYGCETWPVRVADERMLEVFDNASIRRILCVRRRDCVPSVELRRRLCQTSLPALLVQRRLRWFGHAARRPEGELIKDLLLLTPPRTSCRRAGGQLKTWATTIKADPERFSEPRVFGHARWRKDWVKVFCELAQGRQAWRRS